MRVAGGPVVIALVIGASLAACGAPPAAPPRAPRSVVLVTIDTLRADRLTGAVAPELARFAEGATRFTAARTAVPLTLPAHTTLLTGQLPPAHGLHLNGETLTAAVPTLATALQGAGYRTAAFVGAYVLDHRFGLARGFDTYDDRVARDWSAAERLEAERPAAAVIDAALTWLDAAPAGPFFLWVHLYDPHAPYAPPEPYRARFDGRPYDGEVAYASAQVGRLFAGLEAAGRLADAVVTVAGDHGEGLGEHGESTHGMLAYDTTLRVPLLVRAPGVAPGEVAAPVSLADVAATVLRLSDSGASLPRASTHDLFTAEPTGEVYAETDYPAAAGWHPLRVLAGASRKLIRSSELEYFDVAGDPRESTSLAGAETAAARAAVGRLAGYVASGQRATPASPDTQARLRALGYASGPSSSPLRDDAVNPARVIDAWTRFEQAAASTDARQSLAALGALTRAHPGGYVFVTAYARALQAAGRHGDAVGVLRAAVDRFPAEATLFHDLAVAARAAGDAAEALRAEQAALAIDDANAAAHHGLGLLLVEAGRHGEALGAFTRAVELDASNAAYWADLGNVHRDDGDIRAADAAYGRALQIDGAQADAANGRGVLLVQAGRPADAVGWFERALAADPSLHEARLNLGIAYQHSGQYDLAQRTYRELLRTAPRAAVRERQAAADLLASLR